MEKYYPYIRFERYCDDIIVHARSEKQAMYIKDKIAERLKECKLELNESKTCTVSCRNENHREKHEQVKFDFLGCTFRLNIFGFNELIKRLKKLVLLFYTL